MKEPLLTLPISKVKIMQFSPGELHIVSGGCHVCVQPQHCTVAATFYQALDTHHFIIRESLELIVRIPIATQEEASQLSELLDKLQATSRGSS